MQQAPPPVPIPIPEPTGTMPYGNTPARELIRPQLEGAHRKLGEECK